MATQSNLIVDDKFLLEFKSKTEARWQNCQISRGIYGFQFQPGTRWNPGLTDREIADCEKGLGVRFPHDFKRMLRVINGTDIPTLNVYGLCGEPHRTSIGVVSFPRDLLIVKECIKEVHKDFPAIVSVLSDDGFELEKNASLVPVYGHRYIVCGSDLNQSTVLSIVGTDAIVYGDSLRAYLQVEFLPDAF
jgi:hypothetical protein